MTAQGHSLQGIPGSQSVRLYCGGGREDWRWGLGLVWTFSLGGRVVPFKVAPGPPPWAEEKGLVGAAVSNTPQHLLTLPFYLTQRAGLPVGLQAGRAQETQCYFMASIFHFGRFCVC